nr:ketoacyl-ACP synthase III [uncultured Flavobacterium sp.]
MANFKVENIAMTGVSVCVPKSKIYNCENLLFDKEDIAKFSQSTGVYEFREASVNQTTADFGFEAASRLIESMQIDRDEIDILIFVSQTPDYLNIPNTSTILQHKLSLSKQCISFDVPLGCSGFVYGMSVISAYMQNPTIKKGLLVFGDTPSKIVNKKDKSAALLFGDAGGCAIFEKSEKSSNFHFNLGSDGGGANSIIIKDGGFRNPFRMESLEEKVIEKDITRRDCDIVLDGMDVFSFGINQAPKTVKELFEFACITNEDVDYAIFHQANKMMNEMVRKKLKLEVEKVPYSLEKFGNTSSASIPLTLVTELIDKLHGDKKLLFCGFGVGLSWGTVILQTSNIKILDLIEI